ncbi:calcineurin-like phosphoesterase C-terminal domain-containing protein [Thiosocius teredinicola]|uniref:calcineurin-like phosphoesterase C-terminal domain-containing protein n=1 Tax=Thiosocius teredinicola TaxID=1973002 RepID=UPI000F7B56D7
MKKTLISTGVALALGAIALPAQTFATGGYWDKSDRSQGLKHHWRSKKGGHNGHWGNDSKYIATIDVDGIGDGGKSATGYVFNDRDRDGNFDHGERGIPGVMVSNGIEVVLTDRSGRYRFDESTYREDMNIFVSKPACFELPVDANNVPQFAYVHKEYGSAKEMVFGGLQPTGDLPKSINFPMVRGECKYKFSVAISGDPQPYSNIEVGYVRDTLAKELAERDDIEALVVEGDVMGDDLGLMPRFINNMSIINAPQYFVVGNHDLDFDADTDSDSSDSFRRIWGPNYYSFTIGKVHFVTLDNVQYPCDSTAPDGSIDPEGRWDFCANGKTYNGRITEEQLKWLENDLAYVPEDHLIILNYHIPTVSFIDQYAAKHSEDTIERLYNILGYYWENGEWTEGRPALALSGHTHTNEQFRPGEEFEGWSQASHKFPMPFPQIVAGAAAGSWWSGDFTDEQIPESYQRLGAPKGYYLLSFKGNKYKDEFKASGKAADKQMSLSFNSPDFRDWFGKIKAWYEAGAEGVPPVNTNNLGDNKMLPPTDLADTNLVINVWNGSRDSKVWVKFDDRKAVEAERTQRGEGEGVEESLDPFALRRQLNVLRYALKSTESDENQLWNGDLGDRSDGFELFSASMFKADSQRPSESWMWTVQSNHVWNVPVPADLEEGIHRVEVHTTDVHGNSYKESMLFEVRTPNELPDPADNDPTDEKYDRRVPSEL